MCIRDRLRVAGVAALGAVAVGLTGVISLLNNTKEGAEFVQTSMAGIGGALDVVKDRVSLLGDAVVTLFTDGFGAAAEKVKQAVSGIGDEIVEQFNLFIQLEE